MNRKICNIWWKGAGSVVLGLVLAASEIRAEETVLTLVAKDGKFFPEVLNGPRDVKFKVVIKNEGKDAEEFESAELNREKVIPPGKSATIFLGPLKPGSYGFFGEFHQDTAKGVLNIK